MEATQIEQKQKEEGISKEINQPKEFSWYSINSVEFGTTYSESQSVLWNKWIQCAFWLRQIFWNTNFLWTVSALGLYSKSGMPIGSGDVACSKNKLYGCWINFVNTLILIYAEALVSEFIRRDWTIASRRQTVHTGESWHGWGVAVRGLLGLLILNRILGIESWDHTRLQFFISALRTHESHGPKVSEHKRPAACGFF